MELSKKGIMDFAWQTFKFGPKRFRGNFPKCLKNAWSVYNRKIKEKIPQFTHEQTQEIVGFMIQMSRSKGANFNGSFCQTAVSCWAD